MPPKHPPGRFMGPGGLSKSYTEAVKMAEMFNTTDKYNKKRIEILRDSLKRYIDRNPLYKQMHEKLCKILKTVRNNKSGKYTPVELPSAKKLTSSELEQRNNRRRKQIEYKRRVREAEKKLNNFTILHSTTPSKPIRPKKPSNINNPTPITLNKKNSTKRSTNWVRTIQPNNTHIKPTTNAPSLIRMSFKVPQKTPKRPKIRSPKTTPPVLITHETPMFLLTNNSLINNSIHFVENPKQNLFEGIDPEILKNYL